MQIERWQRAVTIVSAAALSGCATIIHGGGGQKVEFTSSPPGASVTVDNLVVGTTPTTTELRRKHDHFVVMELPGYAPQSEKLQSKLSGWVFGNILLGGLIGVVVDTSTGGMYRLSPDELHVNLTPLRMATVPPLQTPAMNAPITTPAPIASAPVMQAFAIGTVLTLPAGSQIKDRPTPGSPSVATTRPETVTLMGSNDAPDAWWFVKNAKVIGWLRATELPRP